MKTKTNTGFTLVELLIVIVLIGIVTTLSIPAMTGFVRNLQLKNNVALVEAQLLEAYSRARNRGETVGLTAEKSADFFVMTFEDEDKNPIDQVYSLEGNTIFSEAWSLQYTPPFGDIVAEDSAEVLAIDIESEQKVRIKVWPLSGLVEREFDPRAS